MNNIKRVGLIALLAVLLIVIESAGAHRVANLTGERARALSNPANYLSLAHIAGVNVGSVAAGDRTFISSLAPTLGNYPDTSAAVGANVTVTPDAAPTNTTSLNVSTSTNFKGTFAADPATGIVRVTNAHPAGTYTVTVRAFDNGGIDTTKTFTLTVTTGTACGPSFTNAADVSVGYPESVAIGDFNNDGKQDLAVATDIGAISIRLGDGGGGFSGTTNVSVGRNTTSVAIGDFNGDGNQDIAAGNWLQSDVAIRLGDGTGHFSGTTTVYARTSPTSVAIGDFNRDGKQDIAVANQGNSTSETSTVSIRLGDGAGGFSGATNVSVGKNPWSVAIGDFNRDGKQDIAVANMNSNTVSIRLGDGLGAFGGTTNVSVGTSPFSAAIGDFNDDGNQDLATANSGSATVSIRLGDGAGDFSGTTEVTVGKNASSVAIGDFNDDGKQDLATANSGSATVSIRLGDGAGGFSGTTEVASGNNPISLAVGDFNNDGRQDFAVANQASTTVSVRLGRCTTPPTIAATTGLSRLQGSPASNSQIATVTDDGGDGNVAVTLTSANPANGVSISNIVNTGGKVTADIATNCTASNASFTLQASDGNLTATDTLSVVVTPNTAPSLAAATGLSRPQGSLASNSQIATVTDDGGNGYVTVTVTSANPSNGMTISNIVNTGGNITADIATNCAASNATFTLQASDGCLTTTDTLSVAVTPNTAPTLAYSSPQSVALNSFLNVTPAATGDNGTVTYSVQPGHGLTTPPTVNNTGVVSITNAQPEGTHTIIVRATDSCGVSSDASFTVTVSNALNFVVTTNANSGAGSLRQAIADAPSGATITFDMTRVVSPIALRSFMIGPEPISGGLVINKDLIIVGPGANLLTITRYQPTHPDPRYDYFRIFNIQSGTVTISGLTMSGGAGGVSNNGTLTLANSTISGNLLDNGGGGGGIANGGTLAVTNSTVSGNRTPFGSGAGISNNAGTVNVTNSTVTGNTAGTYRQMGGAGGGGGISNLGALTMTNSTVSGNVSYGGGSGISNGGTVTLRNTIVTGNSRSAYTLGDPQGPSDINGPVDSSSSFNLIGVGGSGGLINGTNNNQVGVANPGLGALASNGGPTQTRALLPGSPAINAGSNAFIANPPFSGPPFTDQRGTGFPRITNSTVDIGAFESQGFTNSATSGTPQSATILTAFSAPLVATVNSAAGEPVAGGVVTFTAPASGASGTFPGNVTTATAAINASGVATSPTFTANGAAGGPYAVVASIGAGLPTVSFALTNLEGSQPPPSLGNYPSTSVALGANATVTPDAAPANGWVINVATSPDFKGTLAADQVTGVVRVTNAHPAGTYTVTVRAFDSGGIDTTKTFALTVTTSTACAGEPVFTNAANVGLGYESRLVALGDFNNDGKQDFATANYGESTVSIRLGNGAGGFSGTTNIHVGCGPYSVAIGDFNNDGKQDFAAANSCSNTASIRLGNGLGGFSGTTEVSVGRMPRSVAIGDFNGDGKQDIAVANLTAYAPPDGVLTIGTVSIRLGNGLGGFSGTTEVSVGYGPHSVAIGDFNGDGKQDFALVNYYSGTVSIRLGNGTGSFSGATEVSVGTSPYSVAIGDFNNDGKQDIATANYRSSTVSIRLGDGAGGFSGTTDVPVAAGAIPYPADPSANTISVAIGDFNNDGKQDIATANYYANTVSLRLGDGAGGFSGTTEISLGAGTNPVSVAIGDFNNDGWQDLATSNNSSNTASIRLGHCETVSPTPTPTPTPNPSPSPSPSPSPAQVFVQFSSPTFEVTEGCVPATLTVALTNGALSKTRIASTSTVTVDYTITGGTASQKSDYTYVAGTLVETNVATPAKTIVGRLVFEPGETSQTIQLLINEDGFAEGAESVDFTLSNPAGAALGGPMTATLTINDNDLTDSPTNPIDDPQNFVCQQYHDFLHRQPDDAGLAFWTNQITQCGPDAKCNDWMRHNVAIAFFLSIEYQETGYFVDRLYEACLNRRPAFEEFVVDMHVVGIGVEVGSGNWQQQLADNKQKYAEGFVARSEFLARYPMGMTPANYVDEMFEYAGVEPSAEERQSAIDAYGLGDVRGRAAAMRKSMESASVFRSYYNQGFVGAEYFGYLRRDPNDPPDNNWAGYDFWLAKMNTYSSPNDDVTQPTDAYERVKRGEMVKAFIVSSEYRARFGKP